MDIIHIVEAQGAVDEARFQTHTAPNRASTGLRYVRLMEKFLDWWDSLLAQDREASLAGEGDLGRPPLSRLTILRYVETIIDEGVGKYTPRVLVHSLEYFSGVLGFPLEWTRWSRIKRLTDRYAKRAGKGSQAPAFPRPFLEFLERTTLDLAVPKPLRLLSGRLRLCAQASIRYDDLLRTALRSCEWIRDRGTVNIRGLRSKAAQTKTGPRVWVASYLAANPAHDKWLVATMQLVTEAHGQSWMEHDHFGRACSPDGKEFLNHPPKLPDDVTCLREFLVSQIKSGVDVGLSLEEASAFRFHSPKPTLTSLMQHSNVEPKVVRFAGAWKDRHETMPDTYLREAQSLVLSAQERCLEILRNGGDLNRLESAGVPPGQLPKPHELGASSNAMARDTASARHELLPTDVPVEFLDAMMANNRIPETDELAVEATNDKPEVLELVSPATPAAPSESVIAVESDDSDSEDDLVEFFVQLADGKSGKVHLPKHDLTPSAEKVVPRCSSTGAEYRKLIAETEVAGEVKCFKCFRQLGADNCASICGHTEQRAGQLMRCVRPCAMGRHGNLARHRCLKHATLDDLEAVEQGA